MYDYIIIIVIRFFSSTVICFKYINIFFGLPFRIVPSYKRIFKQYIIVICFYIQSSFYIINLLCLIIFYIRFFFINYLICNLDFVLYISRLPAFQSLSYSFMLFIWIACIQICTCTVPENNFTCEFPYIIHSSCPRNMAHIDSHIGV